MFLIFDIGASSGRAILGSIKKDAISFEEVHRFDNRPVFAAGDLCWDVLRLFSEIKAGIEISLSKAGSINSLAIDTWGCDFGLLDKSGRLICNPLHYRDRKRYERAEILHQIIPEKDLFMQVGGPLDRIMGMYNLFSLKYDKAVEYENAASLLMVPDIFNYFLTGIKSNEFTNATMTIMADLNKRQWAMDVISQLGLREDIFAELSEPGAVLGGTKNLSSELGIKDIKVVIPPTHDTAAAVAGIPVREKNKSWAFGILGTWCMTGMETAKPLINEEVFYSGYGNEGGVEGRNMLLKNITGLWIIQQCHEKWEKNIQKQISWKEIDAMVAQAALRDVYIDVDDARFGKVQPDMPSVIMEYCKQTGQSVPSGTGEIASCFYQSLALKFRKNIEMLEGLVKKDIELLHLIGGGVKNRLLCQWISDVLNIVVIAGPTETTSVGNLIFQLIAANEVSDVQEGRFLSSNSFELETYLPKDNKRWQEKYEKFRKLIDQIAEKS